jgi:hypothetical protein
VCPCYRDRMTKYFDGTSAGGSGAEDDDTIDLELTESEIRGLSQAALIEESTRSPLPESNGPTSQVLRQAEVPKIHAPPKRRLRLTVVLSIATAALALLMAVPYLAATRTQQPVHAAAASVSIPTASEMPAPPTIEGVPVRFSNPFDATEVFEFPPGTSRAEARDAVADLLSSRARDRRSVWVKAPRRNKKTADRDTSVTITALAPRS